MGELFVLLPLLLPFVACAATVDPGWSVVAIRGASRAAPPGDDLTAAMEATGFDATSPGVEIIGVVIPGSEHPLRDDEGFLWRLEARRALAGGFGAGVVLGSGEMGSVEGYAEPDPDALLGARLSLGYEVLATAPVATFTQRFHDRLDAHLLAGPAAFRVRVQDHSAGGGEPSDDWRVGALAGAGLTIRVFRGLSLEGRAGYRRVGEVPVGPYTARDFDGNEAVFPGTDIRFDHWFWGVGLGWSF